MRQIQFFIKHFLKEPLWFRVLILVTLLISIIGSSSSLPHSYQAGAKLATAIFFSTYGIKFRRNRPIFILLMLCAILSLYLAWNRYMAIHP